MDTAERLLRIVEAQANDPGLWFVAQTAPEGYLQSELRRLHAAIESLSQSEPQAMSAEEVGKPILYTKDDDQVQNSLGHVLVGNRTIFCLKTCQVLYEGRECVGHCRIAVDAEARYAALNLSRKEKAR